MNSKRNSDVPRWLAGCAGNHASRRLNGYPLRLNDVVRLASRMAEAAHSMNMALPGA